MLKKLISLCLTALLLCSTAFATTEIAYLDAAYALEVTEDAITVTESDLFVNGYGLTGSVKLSLTSPEDATAVVVTAVHNNETQEFIKASVSEEITLTADTPQEYVAVASAPASDIEKYDVKFYLWKKGTLVPIAYSKTVTATYGWSGDPSATAPAIATASDLNGAYEGYYMIKSPEDLAWFSNHVKTAVTAEDSTVSYPNASANAVLCNDIYLNSDESTTNNWFSYRIGTDATIAYKGIFDGAGYSIHNAYMKGASNNGLFGYIDGATIKDLKIENAKVISTESSYKHQISSNYFSAIAVAYAYASTIDNVDVDGQIEADSGKYLNCAGSVVGITNGRSTYIKNCDAKVNIAAKTNPGGNVWEKNGFSGIGGIVGCLAMGGTINTTLSLTTVENCTYNGTIDAPYTKYVSGVIGQLYQGHQVTVNSTTAAGKLTAYQEFTKNSNPDTGILGVRGSNLWHATITVGTDEKANNTTGLVKQYTVQ